MIKFAFEFSFTFSLMSCLITADLHQIYTLL